MRICSFLPSATEMVYALGLGDSLYGVSHECDYPAEASIKPRVVKSKFDPADYTSHEIDRLVSDMNSRGERIYEVDVETLAQARPDLVITQELCEVCAISSEDVQRAIHELDTPPQMISLDPVSLEGVMGDIERLGEVTGTTERARELAVELRLRSETVRVKAAETAARPRVACIEWLDPVIVAGHWIPEMVQLAGGVDVLGRSGAPSRRIGMDELAGHNPEVLILMPCGMDVGRTVQEYSCLGNLEEWNALTAIQDGRAYASDAGALFSRSGPRLVDGLEIMAQMVHPEVFADPLPEGSAKRL